MLSPFPQPFRVVLFALCASLALAGCAGLRAVNTPIEQHDPTHGYRPSDRSQHRDPGRTIITLALSGGGTRAAAFAYGVLEELRDTPIPGDVDGALAARRGRHHQRRVGRQLPSRLLRPPRRPDLRGVRAAFPEEEHPARPVPPRVLRPWNLVRLLTPWLSRSDLAGRYYHEKVFDEATFANLTAAKGPRIHINATDLSSGERFTFSQGAFDVICSDLDVLPVATAVAASSAVPMLLSPITLKNYAGTCGYVAARVDGTEVTRRTTAGEPPAGIRSANRNFLSHAPIAERKKFIHLVDGGHLRQPRPAGRRSISWLRPAAPGRHSGRSGASRCRTTSRSSSSTPKRTRTRRST